MFGLFKSEKTKKREQIIKEYDKEYYPLVELLMTAKEGVDIPVGQGGQMARIAVQKGMNLLARTLEIQEYNAAKKMIESLVVQFMAIAGRYRLELGVEEIVNSAFDHIEEIQDALEEI